MKIRSIFTAMLLLVASISWAQNDNCNGTLTDNVEIDGGEPFELGYTYSFFTVGDEVTATFTLLDTVVGLVGFYQTLNPDFSETGPVFPEPGTQTVSESFPGFSPGDTFSMRIKFSYAGGFSTGDTLTYTVGDNCGITPPEPLELPVTFENSAVDYTFENFAGGVSTVVPNPDASGENTSANVAEMVKGPGEVFGGSVLVLDSPIDFSENKLFKMKVRSPRVGARVLLKVENAGNPGIFFELEDTSTVANVWETLEFDFSPINTGNEYSRIVLIWDLGVVGDGSPNFTFQYDDIELVMSDVVIEQVDLPIDFESTTLDYGLTDFAGTVSSIVTDPEDAGNTVVQTVRTAGSQIFAGTTVGQPLGLENPIPFDFDNTGMSVRVWSPEAGIPVRLKIEQVGNPGIFVETEAATNVAGTWETLEFDFSVPVGGGLNLDQDYDLVTIFFNFGADPGLTPEQTYFWDDVEFAPGVGGFIPTALPIDFDTPDVTFGLIDFGGNVSTIIPDPEDAGNNVVQSVRTEGAAFFAGTTVPAGGLTNRIPFAEGETNMSVRVWSPEAGVPVRMKLESTNSPGLVAEKEIVTTTSGEWETLVFDFSVDALVPVDVNADFNIISLFFNFDVAQVDPAPEQIYLWDDIEFGGVVAPSNDACANAIPVECGATVSGNTADATADTGLGTCVTSLNTAPGLWYSVVGEGGDITASLCGSSFDTKIGIFSGDCSALVCEAGNDDSCGLQSEVTFASADGETYYIYVTGFGANAGAFDLTVTCASAVVDCEGVVGGPALPGTPCDDLDPATIGETYQEDCSCAGGIIPAPNDECASSIELVCDGSEDGTTVGATALSDLNDTCNDFTSSSAEDVWYSFEADGSSSYTVTVDTNAATSGSIMDAVIFVYSGACGDLTEIGCSDDNFAFGEFSGESITLDSLDAGTYYVRVFNWNAGGEEFTISLDCVESGCSDPFPQVEPASLSATILTNGKLRFEWEPVEGQIACQINIVVGSGPQQAVRIVNGEDASSFTAPVYLLVPGTTYNYRVRCGCSQSPVVVGPYTPFASVLYAPFAITEEMGDAYADVPVSQVNEDVQWSNSNLNSDVIGDLFAMATSDSWVRVAPNPAQDNVNLSYNSLSEGQGFIRVFDAQGKLTFERVMTFNEGLNNVNLNMNELENGIYIVEVLKGDSRESVRLLMQ